MNKIWIWTKIVFFGLLLIYVLFFCANNSAQKLELWVWFFKPNLQGTVLKLSVGSFIAGVIATIFVRTTWVTVNQLRDLKARNRSERLHRDVEDMKTKAAMLQPRQPDDNSAKT